MQAMNQSVSQEIKLATILLGEAYGYKITYDESGLLTCPWVVKNLRPNPYGISVNAIKINKNQTWTFSTKFPICNCSNQPPEKEHEIIKLLTWAHKTARLLNEILSHKDTISLWAILYDTVSENRKEPVFRAKTKSGEPLLCCLDEHIANQLSEYLAECKIENQIRPTLVLEKTAFWRILRK